MSFSDDLRMRVKDKSNFTCCWCGNKEKKVEVHHIVPQAEGGPDTEDNAAPLCSNCHSLYGGNPDLRKEIRGRRDNWYNHCNKEYVLVSRTDFLNALKHDRTRDPEFEPQIKVDRITQSNWKLIYEMLLPKQPIEPAGIQSVQGWRFASNSPDPQIALYSGAILGIGKTDNSVAGQSPIARVHNCRLECDVRILDHGTDISNWVGFRVRGIYNDLTLGYLAFLRADGRFDIHRVDEIIYSVKASEFSQEAWTNIQIEIIDDLIKVSINGVQQISITDKWFGGLGHVYIHTFGTHSLFRNFRVFIPKNDDL